MKKGSSVYQGIFFHFQNKKNKKSSKKVYNVGKCTHNKSIEF